MQIKVSDYIVKYLEDYGVRLVFMISGGGAMHLNDSFGASREIRYFCNHHEQASAFGAEGYARISGKLGVVVVTTGPGGTNTITGVMGQWTDSVPVLYISGQVKQETMASSYPSLGLRQLGDQEINIIDIVRPITKFCATVRDPREIKRLLEQAIAAATSERPGPVWLDVPLDVQSALIDTDSLASCNGDEGSRQNHGPHFRGRHHRADHPAEHPDDPVRRSRWGVDRQTVPGRHHSRHPDWFGSDDRVAFPREKARL